LQNHLAVERLTGAVKAVKRADDGKSLAMDVKLADHKLRAFVLDVVNAENRQVDGSDDYLFHKHPEFFPTKDRIIEKLTPLFRWEGEALKIYCRAVTQELRDRLQTVWLAEDEYTAEWRLFLLQLEMHRWGDTQVDTYRDTHNELPPVHAPIHQAIDWVRRNLPLLRTCRSPICRRPFFFPNKGQERFCSKACHNLGKKEHKRRWFNEKGQFKRRGQAPPQQVGASVRTSSGIRGGRILKRKAVKADLKSDSRSKLFLEFIANATTGHTEYIWSQFPMFLPETSTAGQRVSILPLIGRRLPALVPSFDEQGLPHVSLLSFDQNVYRRTIVEELRDRIRTIWVTEDEAIAVWRILNLQRILHETKTDAQITADSKHQPPPLNEPIHRALRFLERNLKKLKKCANPNCETPLFIAAKQTSTYCSGPCASFAAKEYMKSRAKGTGQETHKATVKL
jgi:hypothetical protein